MDQLAPLLSGDTYLSETWAVIVDGQAVQFDDGAGGWEVAAAALHPRTGQPVVSFGSAEILLGTTQVRVDGVLETTSSVRLHLTPARSASIPAEQVLNLEVWVTHPSRGTGGTPYRVRLVDEPLLILAGTS